MTTWNYRIVRRIDPLSASGYWLGIYEAYYDDEGNCDALTEDAISVEGETLESLHADYRLFAEAFTKPVLDYETRQEVDL